MFFPDAPKGPGPGKEEMKMEPFAAYLLVGIVIVLIGIISLGKGSQKKKRCTASASAVIVEVQAEKDDAGSGNTHKKYSYTPIYEFSAGGNTVRKSGGFYSHDKKEFTVGDTAEIKYNPDKPEEFLVNGNGGGKSFGIALLLFGLVIIAIAFTQI